MNDFDLNDLYGIDNAGIYYINASSELSSFFAYGYLVVLGRPDSNTSIQIAFGRNTTIVYKRDYGGSPSYWGSWTQL